MAQLEVSPRAHTFDLELPSAEALARAQLLSGIAADASDKAEKYLQDSEVPEGGE